jgi:CheY-like chemotaxis protein
LTKPVKPAHLRDCIITALANRKTAAEHPADPPAALPRAVPENGSASRSGRILVAEDNHVNQRVVLLSLAQLGLRADAVASGREALRALALAPYDLILMDCQMPDMDGYEATRQIRAGESPGVHMPIVALTARAMQGDREKCLAAGMDDYVAKPVRPEDLAAAIRRWLPQLSSRPS